MEEGEKRTEPITVRLISKEQFCKIMDAILLYDDECSVQANDQIENCFSKYFSNCFRLSSLFPPIQKT